VVTLGGDLSVKEFLLGVETFIGPDWSGNNDVIRCFATHRSGGIKNPLADRSKIVERALWPGKDAMASSTCHRFSVIGPKIVVEDIISRGKIPTLNTA